MRPAWLLAVLAATGCAWLLLQSEPGPAIVAAPTQAEPAPTHEAARAVSLPAQARPAALALAPRLVLPERAHSDTVLIRGRVADARGRLPEDASLQADVEDADADTDLAEDGSFTVRGPPGRYRLVARATGLAPVGVEDLVLAPGEEVRGVDLVLLAGEWVEGRVLAEGEAVGGVRVTLTGAGYFLASMADEEGRFRFDGLPASTRFTVRAFDEGSGSAEVLARSGERGVELQLKRTRTVQGVVIGADGHPVANAGIARFEHDPLADEADHDPFGNRSEGTVMLGGFGTCGPFPRCLAQATTDEQGRFTLEVASGTQLKLLAFTSEAASFSGEVGPGEVELVLAPLVPVEVRTVDGEGRPIRATVTVDPDDTALAIAAIRQRTDTTGLTRLQLWPGVPSHLRVSGAQAEFPHGRPALLH